MFDCFLENLRDSRVSPSLLMTETRIPLQGTFFLFLYRITLYALFCQLNEKIEYIWLLYLFTYTYLKSHHLFFLNDIRILCFLFQILWKIWTTMVESIISSFHSLFTFSYPFIIEVKFWIRPYNLHICIYSVYVLYPVICTSFGLFTKYHYSISQCLVHSANTNFQFKFDHRTSKKFTNLETFQIFHFLKI